MMIRIVRSRFFVQSNLVVKWETSLKMKFAYLIFSVYSTNLQNSALSETCRHVKSFILRYRPFFSRKIASLSTVLRLLEQPAFTKKYVGHLFRIAMGVT